MRMCNIQEEFKESLHFFKVAKIMKRRECKIGIAQPTVSIIPVATSARLLGKTGRQGRQDGRLTSRSTSRHRTTPVQWPGSFHVPRLVGCPLPVHNGQMNGGWLDSTSREFVDKCVATVTLAPVLFFLPGGAARNLEHRDHIKVTEDPAVSPGVFVCPA